MPCEVLCSHKVFFSLIKIKGKQPKNRRKSTLVAVCSICWKAFHERHIGEVTCLWVWSFLITLGLLKDLWLETVQLGYFQVCSQKKCFI